MENERGQLITIPGRHSRNAVEGGFPALEALGKADGHLGGNVAERAFGTEEVEDRAIDPGIFARLRDEASSALLEIVG